MKKCILLPILVCLFFAACGEKTVPKDYTEDILGIWYAVEYENEHVEFLPDGTVEDTFNGKTSRGFWKLDNENALLWINFGDDIFSIQISDKDGKIVLLDNNGTLVRETDREAAREAYQASRHAD